MVDGQHTAIAAVSRRVSKTPLMIVEAPKVARRARAFVAHNTDRLAITPMQLFHSLVVAADPGALAVMRVARGRSHDLHVATSDGLLEDGAKAAIEILIRGRGEDRAIKVLKTLVAAKRGPVGGDRHRGRAAAGLRPQLLGNETAAWA